MKTLVRISAVHLVRIGDDVIVSVEIDGYWLEVIRERADGAFSHIVEGGGILARQGRAAASGQAAAGASAGERK